MLELYHNNVSVCAQKVRIVLAEKDVPWTNHHLSLAMGEHLTPQFKAMNPRGVVPVLVHDGNTIVEIERDLRLPGRGVSDPPLSPKTPLERATMRLWCKLPDDILHTACATVSFAISFGQQLKKLAGTGLEERLMKMPDPARRERQRALIEKGIETPFFRDHIKVFEKTVARDGGAARQDRMVGMRSVHLGGCRNHALHRACRPARACRSLGKPAARRGLVYAYQGSPELQGDLGLSTDRLRRHRARWAQELATDQRADCVLSVRAGLNVANSTARGLNGEAVTSLTRHTFAKPRREILLPAQLKAEGGFW